MPFCMDAARPTRRAPTRRSSAAAPRRADRDLAAIAATLGELDYWTPAVHRAAFALPAFVARRMSSPAPPRRQRQCSWHYNKTKKLRASASRERGSSWASV